MYLSVQTNKGNSVANCRYKKEAVNLNYYKNKIYMKIKRLTINVRPLLL